MYHFNEVIMIKTSALALLGAMTVTTAAQMHPPVDAPVAAAALPAAVSDLEGKETLAVYYSPLDSTRVAGHVGLGMAYHMAVVYTDRNGVSYGASSGPSDLSAPQTPAHALSAILASFDKGPSAFGTLLSDPKNGRPFTKGSAADYFTKDGAGRAYPYSVVLKGRNLSARWSSILGTYGRVDHMKLTYSPVTQNSNSLAATALRNAGITPASSSGTAFVPGAFTRLP